MIRNTISGFSYVGTTDPSPWAFGILALDDMDFGNAPLQPLKPIRFEDNVLRDNQWHMVLVRGDNSTIVNNTFDGTAPGLRPAGLSLSGENVLVDRNRFSNLPQGVVLLGDDAEFGTYLGLAHKAQLNANRFCNVTKNVVTESLATENVEQGTLTCPFTPPALNILAAVLISWPGDETGWTLESAAAVGGPWTPAGATLFLQDGRTCAAVATDAAQRFFRLR